MTAPSRQEQRHNCAEQATQSFNPITFEDTKEIFIYDYETGLYKPGETTIENFIQNYFGEETKCQDIKETVNIIQRKTYVSRQQTLNQNLNLIPMKNGILNIENMQLEPFSPKKKFFYRHPIEYKPLEKFEPLFENPIDNFLNQVCEKNEDICFLKEAIGYCFYRAMPFQNFFILYGKGGNGKSKFLQIIERLLGEENVSHKSLHALVEDNFAMGKLYLKNANIFADLPQKALANTETLKLLTGDDTADCNRKYKESFDFKNYAKIWASCNEVPESPDLSDGFMDRPEIINFPNRFRDTQLENRNIVDEICTPEALSHFFVVCIEAFKMARQDNHWIRRETLEQKKEKYLTYSNSAQAFCFLCLEYEPDSELETSAIYSRYCGYCKERKITPKDERLFFKVLYEHFGHKVYKRRVRDGDKRWHLIIGVDWKGVGS